MDWRYLSVLEPWAGRLLRGEKLWEFRRNPAFGLDGGRELTPGDVLVLVAMDECPRITALAEVREILRGDEIRRRFDDEASGLWRESGHAGDFASFQREILDVYPTVLRLEVRPLAEAIPVNEIRHAHTGKPWSGRGFGRLEQLKRYRLRGLTPLEWFVRFAKDVPGGWGE